MLTFLHIDIDPLLRRVSMAYDGAGNKVRKLDARGNLITMTYDNANRLIVELYQTGRRNSYTWDANDNRILLRDSSGHILPLTTPKIARSGPSTPTVEPSPMPTM